VERLKRIGGGVGAFILVVVIGIPAFLKGCGASTTASVPTVNVTFTQQPTTIDIQRADATTLSKVSAEKCKPSSGLLSHVITMHGPPSVVVLVAHPSHSDRFTVNCKTGKIDGNLTPPW
jgi:hypothetical protein